MADLLRIRPITASVKEEDIRDFIGSIKEITGEIQSISIDRKMKYADIAFIDEAFVAPAVELVKGKKFKRKVLQALHIEDKRRKQRRKLAQQLEPVFANDDVWKISPFEGIGPFKFGASLSEIEEIATNQFKTELLELTYEHYPMGFRGCIQVEDFKRRGCSVKWLKINAPEEAKEHLEEICDSVLVQHGIDESLENAGIALVFDEAETLQGVLTFMNVASIHDETDATLLGQKLSDIFKARLAQAMTSDNHGELYFPDAGLELYFTPIYGMFPWEYFLTEVRCYSKSLAESYAQSTSSARDFSWLIQFNGETKELADLLESLPELATFKNAVDRTMLHGLGSNGSYEDAQAKLLINAGADINALDKGKNTPLHGCQEGKLAAFLIKHGAAVNAQNAAGQTPIHLAAQWGHIDICKALMKTGKVDINAKNAQGQTPWEVRRKTPKLEEYLLSVGALDSSGNAPAFEFKDPDFDWFWGLFNDDPNQDSETAVEAVEANLKQLSVADLYKYQEHLGHIINSTQYHANANDMARVFGVGGDDSFYDLMLWFIVKGRTFWNAMQTDPESLADYDLTWEFESQELEMLLDDINDELEESTFDYEKRIEYRYKFPKVEEREPKFPAKKAMLKKYPKLCKKLKC